MQQNRKQARIRRSLTVYFDPALRPVLDELAHKSGLRKRRNGGGDAELARVLLTSQLLLEEGRSAAERTAAAIQGNAVVELSRRLAESVGSLSADLSAAAGRAAAAAAPDVPRRRRRAATGTDAHRPRVCLALDRWLHGRLVALAERQPERCTGEPRGRQDRSTTRTCAPDMDLVRGVLQAALRNAARHLPVVVRYVAAMDRIGAAIDGAVSAEAEAIRKAISEA
jgi:hypothetical protein